MWFIKKRRTEKVVTVSEFQSMRHNLDESFSRIKRDIQAISDWLTYFKDREQDHENRIKNMESNLEELKQAFSYMEKYTEQTALQNHQKEEHTIIIEEEPFTQKILNDLTDTQKIIFHRLGILLCESNQEWITGKALAQEIYPDKSYDKVRSTLSEYAAILIEAGLLKKRRRGKLTYFTITEKGLPLFEKSKQAKLKKILLKAK